MLEKIVLYNPQDYTDKIELQIKGLNTKHSYLLRQVTGLNPPDKNLFLSELSRDGGSYLGRRVGFRNPVFTIGLNPNPALGETHIELREKLQKVVMGDFSWDNNSHITGALEYEDESMYRWFEGHVETFESEVFEEQSLVQISFICPDPYLRGPAIQKTHPNGYIQLPIEYNGTAETPVHVRIEITAGATNVLTFAVDNQTMVLEHPFLRGDIITINTEPGKKLITLRRGSSPETSILSKLDIRSRWLTINANTKSLSVFGNSPGGSVAVIQSVTYSPRYWGS